MGFHPTAGRTRPPAPLGRAAFGLLLVPCLAATAPSVPARAANLLVNPDFEEARQAEDGPPLPAGWDLSATWYAQPRDAGLSPVTLDAAVVRGGGRFSLRMDGQGKRGLVMQPVAFNPEHGRRFRLAGWIRFRDMRGAVANLTCEFLADKWLGQKDLPTDWRLESSDWREYAAEFDVPEGTKTLRVFLRTDKPNKGTVWFDDIVLEPVAGDAQAPAGASRAGEREGEVHYLVPLDDFTSNRVGWRAAGWGGAPVRVGRSGEAARSAPAGLRLVAGEKTGSPVQRALAFDGPWAGLRLWARAEPADLPVRLYATTEANAWFLLGQARVPGDWGQITFDLGEARYGWGGQGEEDKVLQPGQVRTLSLLLDAPGRVDLDDLVIGVRDRWGIRVAYADAPGNLYVDSGEPTVTAEVFNGTDETREAALRWHLVAAGDRELTRGESEVRLAPGAFDRVALPLPRLGPGYYSVRLALWHDGRKHSEHAVGLLVVRAPVAATRPFVGMTGFGMSDTVSRLAKNLGATITEVFFEWRWLEPTEGALDFRGPDSTVATARELGLPLVGMIHLAPGRVPAWALADPKDTGYLARDPALFNRFVRACAERYRDEIDIWCFCGEIDLVARSWKIDVPTYVEHLRQAYETLKAADPGCIVGGCGVSGVDSQAMLKFAAEVWKAGHRWLDGLFFDPYASPRYYGPGRHVMEPEENRLDRILAEAVRLVRQYGPEKQVAIEEKGWAIDYSLPADSPYAFQMADCLARSYVVARSVPEVERYLWFLPASGSTEGGFDYALWRREQDWLNPRPAAWAYAQVARLLARCDRVRRLTTHEDLWAYELTGPEGPIFVLWSAPGDGGQRSPRGQETTLVLDLPEGCSAADLYDRSLELPRAGRATLPLTSRPIFLRGPAALAQCIEAGRFSALPVAGWAVLTASDRARCFVASRLQKLQKVHVALESAGWRFAPEEQAVELGSGAPAGTSQSAWLDAKAAARPEDWLVTRELRLRLTTADGTTVPVAVPVSLVGVPAVGGGEEAQQPPPPRVDADLSEWHEAPQFDLATQAYLYPPDAAANNLWLNRSDLSVRAGVAWDAESFYFWAAVKDEAHVQQRSPASLWAHDSIQLAFDPENDAVPAQVSGKSGYDEDDSEFGLALLPEGPTVYQWTGPGVGPGRVVTQSRLAVVRAEGETRYEWQVPWALLGIKPQPGQVFGFGFSVLDADAAGESSPYALGPTRGIYGGKDPSQFLDAVLLGTAGAE